MCGAPIQKDYQEDVSQQGLQTGNGYAEPALGLEKLGPSFSSSAQFFTPLIHKPGI